MSPCVATTCPSLTPTITPQPVPQKRQGAFDHLISSALTPPGTGCAEAGSEIPAVAAAMAAACAFSMSRRVSSTVIATCLLCFDMFEHHVRGHHAGKVGNALQAAAERARARTLDDHDDLAALMGMHLDVRH